MGRRSLGLAVLAAAAALALSACSSTADGQSLAHQACAHVDRSVADYLLATKAGTAPATAARLQVEADEQLRAALPLAAAANSDDGSWNGLMTTISESATVDEAHLIPSLRAQCVAADANQNVNPQSPAPGPGSGNSGGGAATTVPQNVNPEPASPAG
ncbi:MAG TPA: hypothetical protein VMF35_07970 [Acidimicrobiales bacterium]|nr:hypothetical protein [Acidimicrobiales bacterium]